MITAVIESDKGTVLGTATFPTLPREGERIALENGTERALYRVASVWWPVNLNNGLAGPARIRLAPAGAQLYPWISAGDA